MKIDTNQEIILNTIDRMAKMNTWQLRRLIFESGLAEEFDMRQSLSDLRENEFLLQTVEETGIHYILADKGREYIKENPVGKDLDERIGAAVSEYRELFEKEKDFIAQYTEQATGVVPVFLSIRKNDKILFKIHVIVPDVETADKIQRHWTENAQAAYESTWKSIAGDLPMPVFD